MDRGIIPRAISAIFSEISKRSDYQFSVHISYLEIYNEAGYDLLEADREVKAMEDLTQVHVGDGEDGMVAFRNLALFRANTEEEALNLVRGGGGGGSVCKRSACSVAFGAVTQARVPLAGAGKQEKGARRCWLESYAAAVARPCCSSSWATPTAP